MDSITGTSIRHYYQLERWKGDGWEPQVCFDSEAQARRTIEGVAALKQSSGVRVMRGPDCWFWAEGERVTTWRLQHMAVRE